MKRMMLFMSLMLVCVMSLSAQEAVASEAGGVVIDLTTFGGITALVSALVTQILKVVPSINGSKLAKIGISAGVGIVVCILGWILKLSDPLAGLVWWQVLIYGLAAGLSGCGFYDLVKAVAGLFKKDRDVE